MTYLNPVYPRDFPDPFVLKFRGHYWAYCTGIWNDGRCFGILHSPDLVEWDESAGAMTPLPGDFPCYWAPEVVYDNGRFYMYYSVGDEATMQIRVAIADEPSGPFVDSGRRLTGEPFAIDPHPFRDDDGQRYLFYATDFLEHSHIGTGTVRDALLDPFTLAGRPQPVTRARFDWQVYDPQREEKGGMRWYTVEGPFVLKHKNRYYQMFSGGNWQDISYGVGYAVSDKIQQREEWLQICDGKEILPILRTRPGQVIGPGHNSVVRGPDNQQLFCIYHRWSEGAQGRLPAIDRLEWVGERLVILGPTTTPQPGPLPPAYRPKLEPDATGQKPAWHLTAGQWRQQDGAIIQDDTTVSAEARLVAGSCFVAEVSVRLLSAPAAQSGLGLTLHSGPETAVCFLLRPEQNRVIVERANGFRRLQQGAPLPHDFNPAADHLLRLEANGGYGHFFVDDMRQWNGELPQPINSLALTTEQAAAAFDGFALTIGWQDLFMEELSPAELGWKTGREATSWTIRDGLLQCDSRQQETALSKGPLLTAYEFVVNVRLVSDGLGRGTYGFYPVLQPGRAAPAWTIEAGQDSWFLRSGHDQYQRLALPPDFDPFQFQQFRFSRHGETMRSWLGQELLGEVAVPAGPAQIGLYGRDATVAFDMVRLTAVV